MNGGRIAQTYRLQEGDEVRVPPVRVANREGPAVPVGSPFTVVPEDDALLVVDKPAGLAVHGGSGVVSASSSSCAATPGGAIPRAGASSRSRDPGLLIVARKRSALTVLHDQMREAGSTSDIRPWLRGAG